MTRDMKDSHQQQEIRVHTHNDTDTGYAKRRDTRQSAARLGRAPQDHLCARVILQTTAARDHGKNSRQTGRL